MCSNIKKTEVFNATTLTSREYTNPKTYVAEQKSEPKLRLVDNV